MGYVAYAHTGWGAEEGERQKRASWDEAIKRRVALSAHDVRFVPFSIEAGGAWGPAAKRFFSDCLQLADSDRNVDLYHWSTAVESLSHRRTPTHAAEKGRFI